MNGHPPFYRALNPLEIERLRDALCDAFLTSAALAQVLRLRLNRSLARISEASSFATVAFHVVEAAEAEGWTRDLIREARSVNPGNSTLTAIAEEIAGRDRATSIAESLEPKRVAPPEPTIADSAHEHIAILFEVNRTVDEARARAAMAASGFPPPDQIQRLQPLARTFEGGPADDDEWRCCFAENLRFVETLRESLRRASRPPVLHLFALAPLPLAFHFGMLLDRHRVVAYQQDRGSSAWSVLADSSVTPPADPYFVVDGLPRDVRGGAGTVHLSIEVTQSIAERANATFALIDRRPALAAIRLSVGRGVGPTALGSPAEAARAVADLRALLDQVRERLPGAERVLLAMAAPVTLATLLGRAVNTKAQHKISLFNFRSAAEPYREVYTIESGAERDSARPAVPGSADWPKIVEALQAVSEVHADLARFLRLPDQAMRLERAGGAAFLDARIDLATEADVDAFEYPYFERRLRLAPRMLLALAQARGQLEAPAWRELIRLFLLHEGFHVGQRLTSYNHQGVGRAGFVLEAVDYDADAFAVESCVAWRKESEPRRVAADGEMATLADVLGNVVSGLAVFDGYNGRPPLAELTERRLRRYLIWHLQRARARWAPATLASDRLALRERLIIEAPGVPVRADFRDGALRPIARLSDVANASPLELAIYVAGRLVRLRDEAEVRRILDGVARHDGEGVLRSFSALFDAHRELVPT